MFKFKLALIVVIGLLVHTPRDWAHRYPPRPPQAERLSNSDLVALRAAIKLAGRESLRKQAALAASPNAPAREAGASLQPVWKPYG
jgi:hypothetical protein